MQAFQKGVFYQIYPRSFKDSNGDGIGDIPGIIQKLDYLVSLGVNYVWLSPVYASPNADYGYDISDYLAINPEYGTMSDMERLIAEGKKRGIHFIMDLVMNHTSSAHAWFQASLDPNSPYRDYYYHRPGKGKKRPNNWTSFFGEQAWSQNPDGSYYLHLFAQNQPDLNWDNPKIYDEFKTIIEFWLRKGIAGFRCDVVNVISKKSLANGKPRLFLKGLEHYHSTPRNHEILKRIRQEIIEPHGAFLVGETVMVDTQQANDLLGSGNQKELDMLFSFEHMDADQFIVKWFKKRFNPNKFNRILIKWQQAVGWNAIYFENHDQPRSLSRYGSDHYHKESAKMLSTVLLTLKGSPFIYQGQEIGMTNVDYKSIDDYMDVETHNIWALAKRLWIPHFYRWHMIKTVSRDNARSPMQWDAKGGFTTGKPWLRINHNQKKINVENQIHDGDSILSYYKRLIKLRQLHPALIEGEFIPIYAKRGLFAYHRKSKNEQILIIVNMTAKYKKFNYDKTGEILLRNYPPIDMNRLRPYEALIIEVNHD